MSVHDEILGFLDGSLSSDAEAELLHRMSVSPERRAVLRGFFRQQAMFDQDKSSIQVPYDAEQGLWAKLDAMMPAAIPAAMTAATATSSAPIAATSVGFLSKLSASSVALIGSLMLLVGFGGGYLLGNSGSDNTTHFAAVQQATPAPQVIYREAEPKIIEKERIVTRYITRYVTLPSTAVNTADLAANTVAEKAVVANNSASQVALQPIGSATPVLQPLEPLGVGGEKLTPIFVGMEEQEEAMPAKSFLQRFEFSFNESFGKQFPNTEATNTTLPLITNSAISTFFQVLPRSNKLWIGASVGTANVTRKALTTVHANSLDPLEEEIRSEYVHVQSNWAGAFLQYRAPIMNKVDMMLTSGYGFATAGQMLIGELGLHVDATKDVGFTAGLRGTRLSYDLKSEMSELMNSRKGSLSVPRGVTEATPSYNIEIATGLFFHF